MRKSTRFVDIIPFGAIALIKELNDFGYEAYLVGGCVRDLLLKLEPNDWDICTDAKPNDIIRVIKHAGYKYHTVGIEYGTVTAIIGDMEYEITTYRADGNYSDGRHPDAVDFVRNLIEDLKRRDLDINAMAYDPLEDIIIDEFNGQESLNNKVIRAVGNPEDRIIEDPLRILRILRLAVKLGFEIESELLIQIKKHKDLLNNISKERITAELIKLFNCGKSVETILYDCRDILAVIIPELEKTFDFEQNNKYHRHDVFVHTLKVVDACRKNKFEIKLAALLHDIGKPDKYTVDDNGWGHFYGHPEVSYEISKDVLSKRLRLTTEQSERVLNLVKYHDMHIVCTKASVKRALNKHGVDMLNDWFILKQADMDDHIYPDKSWKYYMDIPKIKELMQEILDEQACFSLKDLAVNGKDIMDLLSIKPGKQVGEILKALLDEVIDEKLTNDKVVLLGRAAELFK